MQKGDEGRSNTRSGNSGMHTEELETGVKGTKVLDWVIQNRALGHSIMIVEAPVNGVAAPMAVLVMDPTLITEILCRQREVGPPTTE